MLKLRSNNLGKNAMKHDLIQKTLLASVSLFCLGAAGLMPADVRAAATEAKADDIGLEEIIVTATKRKEALIDVPIAINAFTADTIAKAGIARAEDFVFLTPNVHFAQTTNVGESQIHIRGITQPRDTEAPFAYVVDGVLSVNPNAFNEELVDVQQIEVVKGPQGALYGRNAIGGAIIVTTKTPTNDPESMAMLSYGNGNSVKAQGAVSGALIKDVLFARLAVSHNSTDGFYNNIYLHEKVDHFKEDTARLRLIWQASEKLKLDFRLEGGKVRGNAVNFNLQFPYIPGTAFAGGLDIMNTSMPYVANVRSLNNQNRWNASMKADYTTDYGVLSLTTAYAKLNENLGGDGAFNFDFFTSFSNPLNVPAFSSSPADGTQYQERNEKDASAELRFVSNANERFRWIAGAYFADIKRETVLENGIDTGAGIITQSTFSPAGSVNPTATLLWSENHNKAYALFGQAAYDIVSNLELAVALRWDKEDRTNTNLVPNVLSPAYGTPLTLYPGLVRSVSYNKLQPKVSLRYKVDKDASIYASFATGFRSGGFNPPGSHNLIAALDNPNTTVQDDFKPETSKSFEAGFKTQWLDHRLSLNGSVFYTEVKNAQYFSFYPVSLARVITNIDSVHIKGLEIEANARVATGVNIYGGVGLIDSKIKANANDPTTIGSTYPYTPKYSITLGAQVLKPITDSLNVLARVDYNRSGNEWFDPINVPGTELKGVDLVNARLGIQTDSWSLTAWGKNLLDKSFNTDAVVVGNKAFALSYVSKAAPRTYGLEYKVNF
jgi:iron complex outermembrane receptor protein